MIDARLLEIRKTMKRRKPNFKILNSNDPKKRFAGRWKRPKGLQSKMRERRKGNPRYIEPGYGSPAAVRGATAQGLFPVVVSTLAELTLVTADQGVVIAATVGMKKRAAIVKAVVEKNLTLLNFNADDITRKIEAAVAGRKKRRQELMERKKSSITAAKKAVAESKPAVAATIETVVDEEAKKKAEKEEKDKLLTRAV